MSTNWQPRPTQDEPRWQQPDFSAEASPPLSGAVLRSGDTQVAAPAAGTEEQRLRAARRLLIPIAVAAGVITGMWWQVVLVAVITSVVLRRRIWQLAGQRLAGIAGLDYGWRVGPTDLR